MLFISTSGVLGRYIDGNPEAIIFLRAVLATVIFLLLPRFGKNQKTPRFGTREFWIVVLSGILLTVHWVTYFHALQKSSVAIGMLSLFTYPIITSILEPVFLSTRFQWKHVFLTVLSLLGIYLLLPNGVETSGSIFEAVCWGIASALSYSIRNLLLKKRAERFNDGYLMTVQVCATVFLLLPFMDWGEIARLSSLSWVPILFLAIFTTVLGHTLFLGSFKKFSVTTASIMSCTQPIFGIALGAMFLQEYPEFRTYIGGLFILGAVVWETVYHNRD